ncbi:zinc dependent phospholipase C family protein [Methylotenera sp. N17]|uniref:zinc dependent phospholipase C family protein n=1 Tax=Methylotenera sp. N17 TaxID=1502761 RepID=UPI0006467914|nr:zinc dependent phospholipase C family protein [Methylotenera sp. N17]
MPGAFAHITLVNLLSETPRLEAIPNFPIQIIPGLLRNFKFCELGAVSPDYPYLAITDKKSLPWADRMHYTRSGEMIHAGIANIKAMNDGLPKRKAIAWLLGYAAHMITDVTIHPIVELKVGPYAQNKTAHRRCEMHQDSYIFQRLKLSKIGISEHFDSGIRKCGKAGVVDSAISTLWSNMFNDVYPEAFIENPPDINKWHQAFDFMVDKVGEEGHRLLPLARHVAVNCGLTYPNPEEIDMQYIEDLHTPNGPMHYDDIFDQAVANVGNVWAIIARAIVANDNAYKQVIGNWNFDTGRDQHEKLVYWV